MLVNVADRTKCNMANMISDCALIGTCSRQLNQNIWNRMRFTFERVKRVLTDRWCRGGGRRVHACGTGGPAPGPGRVWPARPGASRTVDRAAGRAPVVDAAPRD